MKPLASIPAIKSNSKSFDKSANSFIHDLNALLLEIKVEIS